MLIILQDIEGNPFGTSNAVTSLVCGLQSELRRRLGPTAILSFDAPSLPTCYHDPACNASIPDVENYDGRFDFAAVAACSDMLMPMGYDLTGVAPNGGPAAANSPLSVVSEGVDEGLTILTPAHRTKLVVLLPWYGYDEACRPALASSDGEAPLPCLVQVPWGANNHEVGFGTIFLWQQLATISGRDPDGSPWFERHNSSGWRRRVYYDDSISIHHKVSMAVARGIGGVGVWTADTLEALDGCGEAAAAAKAAMWQALWP